VKRLRLEDTPGLMANVFKVIDIEKEDRLRWVLVTSGEDEIILTTAEAQAIRFKENEVRPTGLGAGGMRGIKLGGPSDKVVGASIARDDMFLWVITDIGIAKVTPLTEYPTQGRAGSGVITMKLPQDSKGLTAATTAARLDGTVIVLTSKNRAKSMKFSAAPLVKRPNKGDYVISVSGKEEVVDLVTYTRLLTPPASTPANGASDPSGA
jgi:DNA gyrase subunit A